MIGTALLFETDVGTMPVHPQVLGRHQANHNMQDTVLAQLLYHLNTAHTYVACVPRWYDSRPPFPDAVPASNQRLVQETTLAQLLCYLHLTHFLSGRMTASVLQ